MDTRIGVKRAMNALKNETAISDGDVRLTHVVSISIGGTGRIGDAYRCTK